jgi:hypothetical protein
MLLQDSAGFCCWMEQCIPAFCGCIALVLLLLFVAARLHCTAFATWPCQHASPVLHVCCAGVKVTRSGGAVRHGAAEAGEWQQERQRLQQEYLNKQVGGRVGPTQNLLPPAPASHCAACRRPAACDRDACCSLAFVHPLLTAALPAKSLQGVDCGEVTLLVHVRPCEGLVRSVDGTIEKRFAKKEVAYPLEVGG